MKVMKVFLCQGYLGPKPGVPLVFPIGLAYIASAIKAEHEVYCWDPNTVENPMSELPGLLEKIEPDVFGLSLRNIDIAMSAKHTWFYPLFVNLIQFVRKKLPHCKIVVGGAGFSLFAEEVMRRNSEIDFGVVFEGDLSFAQLLRDMSHPERTKNIVFRKNGQIFFSERRSIESFVQLPSPSRELFDIKKYQKNRYSFNVMTKKGCEFNCILCPNNFVSGCGYSLRSPKSVVDEIEHMKNALGIDNYYFADSTFNFPFEYSRRIIQELGARKLDTTWMADFHPSFSDEHFVEEAVKTGCKLFNFSPDGATDNALRLLRKDMRLDDIKKTISLVKKVEDAKACYNFVYDLPKYNSEQVTGLARLIPLMNGSLREKLFGVFLTRMRIYPHTELYDLAIAEKIIRKDTSTLYPIYYSSNSISSRFENMFANFLAKSCYVISEVNRFVGVCKT
jgi:anaerobic magnesium-protoporphyrin IX monomethyl ester cyclase